MLIVDILYLLILGLGTYYSFFNIILWYENRKRFVETNKLLKLSPVTILIPVYNEEDAIEKTLRNILRLDYPKDKLKILLIDDGSTDSTYHIAKKYEKSGVRILRKKNSGKAGALNFGLKHVDSEFFVVMDGDSLPNQDTLKTCMKYFNEDKVAAVTTRILSTREKFWQKLQYVESILVSFQRKLHEFPNIINCTPGPFSIYKTDVVRRVGGFDEKNLVEDVEIAWRLLSEGYKIRLAFDSNVHSVYPYSFKIWWKQRTRWTIGGIQTLVKYFKTMFGRNTHGVGNFLVPTSFLGYVLGVIGLGLFIYLVYGQLFNLFFYLYKSAALGINPFTLLSIGYIIDWKRAYGITLAILFFTTLKIALSVHRIKVSFLLVLVYMFVYTTLFPFITLNGIYRYLRKERGWLTK